VPFWLNGPEATEVSTETTAAKPATDATCFQSTVSKPRPSPVNSAIAACAKVLTARSAVCAQKDPDSR